MLELELTICENFVDTMVNHHARQTNDSDTSIYDLFEDAGSIPGSLEDRLDDIRHARNESISISSCCGLVHTLILHSTMINCRAILQLPALVSLLESKRLDNRCCTA